MALFPSQNGRPYRWLPALMVVMTVVALAIGAVALHYVETVLVASAGESLALAASDIAGRLDLLLAERYGDIQIMAKAQVFRGSDRAAMTEHLQALKEAYPLYEWLGVTDAQGRIVASTDSRMDGQNRSRSPWFQAAHAGRSVVVGDIEPFDGADGGMDVIAFTAPILTQEGEFLGAVTTRVALTQLEETLTQTLRSIQSQRALPGAMQYQFLTQAGLAFVDSDLAYKGFVNLKRLGLPSALMSETGRPGFVEEEHLRRHVAVITGYARTKGVGDFSGLHWSVLVRMDRSDILAPIMLTVWRLGGAGSLIFLPMLATLFWATRRLEREWAHVQKEQGRAAAAETKFQKLMESAPDAIVITGEGGRIRFINRQAATLFGYAPEELIGQAVEVLVPDRLHHSHQGYRARTGFTGPRSMGVGMDLVGRKKDGSEFPAEISLSRAAGAEETYTIAVVRDLTQRKQAEARQAAQLAVSMALAESAALDEAAPRLLQAICEGTGWELGAIWQVDCACGVLRCETAWHVPAVHVEGFMELSRETTFSCGVGLPGRVWASGAPAWVSDVGKDANFPRAVVAAQAGLHGAFAFPIASGNETLGVMEFFSREVRQLDEGLLDMMADIGLKVGQFVVRKRAEERQEQLAKDILLLLDATRGGIYGLDGQGRCTFINRAGAAMLGYEPKELLGRPLHEVVHHTRSDGSPYPVEACPTYQILQGGAGGRVDDDVLWRKDGTSFPAGFTCSPILDEETVQGVVVTFADITEAKRARQEVQRAREKAEKAAKEKACILAAVETFFIGIDANGIVTEWTPAAELVFGVPASTILGQHFKSVPVCWNWEAIDRAIGQCRTTFQNITLNALSMQTQDKPESIVKLTMAPLEPDTIVKLTVAPVLDDQSVGVVIMGEDVTERLRLERELAHAQKLESIGQLAAGIAHEINTPTQYIGDNVRFLQEAFTDMAPLLDRVRALGAAVMDGTLPARLAAELDEVSRRIDLEYLVGEVPKAVQQSLEGIERVATIVRAMKEFAHPDTGEKTLVDLNKAVQSTSVVARNEWKYVADLVTDLDSDLPPVPCLPGAFNQVVLNLIVNAAHAIGDVVKQGTVEKGTITVGTRRVGEWAEIRIRDTGTGIPEAVRGRIFDPFFTTKEVGKGTGQGLAIARSVIVDKHKGTLTFETEVGQGTTFIIRIPLEDSTDPGDHRELLDNEETHSLRGR